ncbi:hypothetical protein BC826DRAFT_1187348 [Russula brevipes]|nr:hypothetical protein BC826DRAFT_1187348 [Russula brevipes]
MADTDDESKPSSLAVADNSDLYLTEHLAAHLAATRHHLTGAPEPPEPPYAPSFHPPTGYWSSAEKALFFRALSVHSRLRPDLLAASVGTKSTADVAVYLSLLREGAAAATGTIARDQRPAAHEVSAALVALEDQLAARVCAAEPARVREELGDARAEAERAMKNGMRVRRGEGGEGKGVARDREGQDARRAAFERWRGERELGWAREDVLARLDVVGLQVLDRILRLDEERRVEGGSGDEHEDGGEEYEDEGEDDRARQRRSAAGPSTTLLRAASLSSIAGESHATTPPPSSPPAPIYISDDDKDDGGPIPPNLSPISRRRIHKRLYMRRKRAEASGAVAQLDPARLKPGRKASATSRYKQPHHNGDSDSENPKQPARGDTRPYKIQRELERLGIGADYLRANGLDLFHLGALGRLMRLYPRLDASRPAGFAESLAAETIQMLHTLVVQFTRDLVRRAIALRDLDFALCAHTKVWGLGERVVRPPHVRRALELCGGSRLSKRMHFEGLLGRFSEGEESTTDDDDDDDDVPLAVRARSRKAKAIARDENENGEDGEGGSDTDTGSSSQQQQQQQQQQQAGPGKEALPHDPAAARWSSAHRAMYSPFVYAPDLLAPAHPFGVYAPGTTPTTPDPLRPSARLRHASGEDEDEEEEDLMPGETDDEALACELRAEAVLDAADARTAAAYEAGVWRELRDAPGRRMRKRRAGGDGDGDGDVGGEEAHAVRLRKRRRVDVQGGWTLDAAARAGIGSGAGVGAEADLLRSPDGLKVKSAAVIEDSDSDSDWIGD